MVELIQPWAAKRENEGAETGGRRAEAKAATEKQVHRGKIQDQAHHDPDLEGAVGGKAERAPWGIEREHSDQGLGERRGVRFGVKHRSCPQIAIEGSAGEPAVVVLDAVVDDPRVPWVVLHSCQDRKSTRLNS